jgi:peroxiredoxin
MKNFTFCVLLSLVLVGISLGQSKTKSYTKIGDQMPQFSVKDTDKNSFDISELKGKLLFINFQIWSKYKDSANFRMLAIAREEANEEIIPFKKDYKLTFPIASDSDRSIFKLFGDGGIPRSYVVGTDGKIIFQLVGFNSFQIKRMIALIDSEMAKFETKSK